MKYKVLVLDIDGTLRTSEKEITQNTHAAIDRLIDQGVKVVIASGRPTFGVMPTVRELRLNQRNGYILSNNGGIITDCSTGEKIYEVALPQGSLRRLGTFAAKHHCSMLSHYQDELISDNPDNPFVSLEARINGMPSKEVTDWGEYDKLFRPNKCIVVNEGHILEHLEPLFREEFKEDMNIFRSEPFFLEVVPKGVDKALSLAVLLKRLGLTREETVACGDGFNDLSMIRFAGLGVAMGNAQPIVKEAADFVTLSNDEDGVAYVIEKFFC